jgi:hypothetical protein
VIGGMYWGNVRAGILAVACKYLRLSTDLYDNGIGSSERDEGEYAGIRLDNVSNSLITGCLMYDRGDAWDGGSAGSNPYPGKPSRRFQTYALQEVNGSDRNVITGNMMDGATLRVSQGPLDVSGAADVVSDNFTG